MIINQYIAPQETPANDNVRTPGQQKIIDDMRARQDAMAATVAPTKDYLKMARRLARRQQIGGTGPVAANDNKSWPLAEQLRREGNDVLLAVAERYRRTYDSAHTEAPLIGTQPDDFYSVEQRHSISSKTGKLKNDGPKRARHTETIGDGNYKAVPIDDDVRDEIENKVVTFRRKPMKPAPKKWNGDNILLAAIDAKATIWRLQDALGPLLEVFEDAVLHGETLSDIGERKGANTVARGPAGRILVMMGLEVVQREFHRLDRQIAA